MTKPFRPGQPLPVEEGVDVTRLVGFADRKIGQECSWIFGDPLLPGSGFCGKPVKINADGSPSSWCPEHHARVYPPR